MPCCAGPTWRGTWEGTIKRVEVAEAAGQLDTLLEDAGNGEVVELTRAGRTVGRLVGAERPTEIEPIRDAAQFIADGVAFMRAHGIKPFSRDELVSLIREGRDR